MKYELRIAGKFYDELYHHLFPGDGKEAVAIVLCGRHEAPGLSILLTHEILLIPHNECERTPDSVSWKTNRVIPFLEQVEKKQFALLKIHSHPGGYARFSTTDDTSDREFFTTVFNWSETKLPHASAIMLPDGRVFGRAIRTDLTTCSFSKISCAGNQIRIWNNELQQIETDSKVDSFSTRNKQMLGNQTYHLLQQLSVGVVGCSGTGSPTIEQLCRLGVGQLVLVDPDKVEEKNLNRIIQARITDAKKERYKIDVMADAIQQIGLGTKVKGFPLNLFDSKDTLAALIKCDIIFGCVDSAEGRHLLSQLSNFYLIPYFDMGVQLNADGKGGIDSISGTGHYIQPGLSTLFSRHLYSQERLEAEGLLRQYPSEYAKRIKAGYIRNAIVDRPAVLPINMLISSMTVIDFLNRIHGHSFKEDGQTQYARMLMDYSANCIENKSENKFYIDIVAAKYTGRGDMKPFLRLTELDKL